uniref:Uncharacterized protein n=1 Tax=Mandrillus leucophaeus TaxID=9568 RepID=A0A2K5XWI6_MANLE
MKEALHQIVVRCSELVSSTSLPRLSVSRLQGPPESQPLGTLGRGGRRLLGIVGSLAPETLRGLGTEFGPCTHPLPFDMVRETEMTSSGRGWLLQCPQCARTLLCHCGPFLTPRSQASSCGFQLCSLKTSGSLVTVTEPLSNFPFSYFP